MKPSLILVGAGGHARSCIDVLECLDAFAIAGCVGVEREVGAFVAGYPILFTDAEFERRASEFSRVLIALGQLRTPDPRISLFDRLSSLGCAFPPVISPRAYVSRRAIIGDGTIVMHGAVVNAHARIGRNCIVNSNALVEHDAVVDDHCHVATAAVLNGGVRVGSGSFVGSGALVLQGVSIGKRCVIAMGCSVRKDCEDGSFVSGRGQRK